MSSFTVTSRAGKSGFTKGGPKKGTTIMGRMKTRIAKLFGRSVPEREQVELKSDIVSAEFWNPVPSYGPKPEPLLEQYWIARKATYFFADKVARQYGKRLPIDYHNNPVRNGVRPQAFTKHHLPGATEDVRHTVAELLRNSRDRMKFLMDRNVLNNKAFNAGIPLSIGMPRLTRVVSYFATHVEGYEVSMDLFVFKNDLPEPCEKTGLYPTLAA